MDPLSPVTQLPRTSPITLSRLKKAEITSLLDLVRIYPNRHIDFSTQFQIGISNGSQCTATGMITSFKQQFTRRGFKIQKAILTLSGSEMPMECIWFNQIFLSRILKPGMNISCAGVVNNTGKSYSMEVQEYEVLHGDSPLIHTGRVVPYHPQIAGISARTLREKIWYAVQQMAWGQVPDILSTSLQKTYKLLPYKDALRNIHFPHHISTAQHARETLAFYELFERFLHFARVKDEWKQRPAAHPFHLSAEKMKRFKRWIDELPFTLTDAQKRAIEEITNDLKQQTAMNRFLQGDVGSGKTVIAAAAAYMAHINGFRTLCMAPTEILAQQHFATFTKLLQKAGLSVDLITSQTNTKRKKSTSPLPQCDVLVGTQALLTDSTVFDKVGLVIIDEQHRFGVKQRATLKQKGTNPHLLTMTATPIPRTISLVMFGELDMTVLDEMPKGRKPIKTYVVPLQKRQDAYNWIKKLIKEEHIQTYIICPLIDESESESMKSIKAATTEFEILSKNIFPELRMALLHGKCKPTEKEHIMNDFRAHKSDILVSTSVVEVGVDVPNANIIIIEGAERFGLAQLHQLRGRVGRGDAQSYCLLFTSEHVPQEQRRLSFFAKTNSGLQLAEYDLKIRGPGEIYGTSQHGYSDLQLADLSNFEFVAKVQSAVQQYLFDSKHTHTSQNASGSTSHISRD